MSAAGARILVRAPLGRDEQVLADLLGRHGYDVLQSGTAARFEEHLERGVDVLVLSEEALAPAAVRAIGAALEAGPSWAALPMVVLLDEPAGVTAIVERLRSIRPALTVSLLTRPAPALAVVSAVDGALRVRQSDELVGQLLREREAAEAKARLLLGELDHRIKNLLSTINALSHQTIARAADPEDFMYNFSNRLQALARTHDVLAAGEFQAVALRDLAGRILSALAHDEGQLAITGPDVVLPPGLGQTVGMCLHELGTNAVKYGALSVPCGRVDVAWSFDPPSRRLGIVWRESGGPAVRPPEEESFGLMFIKGSVRLQMGGEVGLDFAPQGLRCTMRVDLPESVAAQPAALRREVA